MASNQELADMEKLSAGYVPDTKVRIECHMETYINIVQGPLVSELLSSQALAVEYAKADPAFASKTKVSCDPCACRDSLYSNLQALPATYPCYRTVRGDGNCGWRGTLFAFTLLRPQNG